MDEERADDDPARAVEAVVVTGSLTSGGEHRPRRRARTVVLALAGAGLLAGGFLAPRGALHHDRLPAAAPPASTSAAAAGAPAGPHSLPFPGRRGFDIDSDSAAASIVIGAVARVPTLDAGSALELDLRLDVWAGAQVVTTDTFVAADPDGGPPTRASGVTVLEPGSRIVPSDGGFRIASPSSVDVRVILDLPPGDHVVSVLGESADQVLASFSVSG
jgi:hypothetical protein